ncbi:threonyl-tRNA synthetase [Pseudomonas sp. 3296]|uniref:His/Gly/Thr/Pro-type tRNA ligase C-terminal domain-containing protein n=1 Tax=Pseudomonas sp. 3296 TaxID=2817753 RepID=UPI00285EA3D1|nr:His/Gly/Thr/Pro-type tRNA ligase C-terminal domain-containing protein [Pseudomonas sp. 3296]MDR6914627.1 threonyl-tRNA synthetase [Pseudomonas sp. 3296]
MIQIRLPDGSLREYDQPLSVYELAASISPALAKAAVAGRVDGVLVDCEYVIRGDARVNIVTPQEPDGLEILRRSCALILAMAVKQLHPHVQLQAGSALGDGFYCGFTLNQSLTRDDLPLIEARMQLLAATNHSIRRRTSKAEDRRSLYRLGDFEHLTAGPQVPATKVLQAFSLDYISGTTEQRIYGTCWTCQQELDSWRAPPLVMIVSMAERQASYVQSVTEALRRSGVHVHVDLRHEKVRHKIREHGQKVPYLMVVGEKEQEGEFVSLRSGAGEDFGRMSVEVACQWLNQARSRTSV